MRERERVRERERARERERHKILPQIEKMNFEEAIASNNRGSTFIPFDGKNNLGRSNKTLCRLDRFCAVGKVVPNNKTVWLSSPSVAAFNKNENKFS